MFQLLSVPGGVMKTPKLSLSALEDVVLILQVFVINIKTTTI